MGRLRRALPGDVRIRGLEPGDADLLRAIEARAAALFADHGYPQVAAEPTRTAAEFRDLVAGRATFVARDGADRAVGFAVASDLQDLFWLHELSVDPDRAQAGIGSALLDAVLAEARRRFHRAAGLTTFRAVPFNAPFYSRRGFLEQDSGRLPSELLALLEAETPRGCAVADRVLMIRYL